MKKQKYIEQYKTCAFFARINYYTIVGKDSELASRCYKLLEVANKNPLFGDPKHLNKISDFISDIIPSISWIFRIPFINDNWSTNPRKMYQKWCKMFDGQFTSEEIKKIIDDNIENGCEHDWQADVTWNLIQHQKTYIPLISEVKWIYNRYKYGSCFVTILHR